MKILVVVLDNLGDVVLASSVFAPLRRAYPTATFGVFVKAYAHGLFNVEGLRIHAADPFWDRAPGRPKGQLLPFLRAIAEIRAARYDVAYVLNADWRRSLVCQLAGIPVRIGHAQRKSRPFLTEIRPHPKPGSHVSALHASLLPRWLTIDVQPFPELGLLAAQAAAAGEWRSSLAWHAAPIVVFHPITGDTLKNWPLTHWATLGQLLASARSDLRFVILHTEGERPRLAGSFFPTERFPSSIFQFVAGDISSMKSILSTASLVIAGDSGPGHVAAALGRPLLSLFGPSDARRYKALGPDVQIVSGDPLTAVRPDDVCAAALAMLTPSARPREAFAGVHVARPGRQPCRRRPKHE